jgi:predicted nucleotide-binding protein (sugar kinase/HSP70/actin superfamily)
MHGYLLYHSKLKRTQLDGIIIYHDYPDHNQDPYLWNTQFLHTYCHMNNLRKMEQVIHEGDISFWVSAGKKEVRKNFTVLLCDLVFVVKDKIPWQDSNYIKNTDPLVDSKEAYEDHYQWWIDHEFKEKQLRYGPRFTLEADASRSFQPLDENQQRIDILEFLLEIGVDEQALRNTFGVGLFSRPFHLDSAVALSLYDLLSQKAYFIRTGDQLQKLRQQYPEELSSDRLQRRSYHSLGS